MRILDDSADVWLPGGEYTYIYVKKKKNVHVNIFIDFAARFWTLCCAILEWKFFRAGIGWRVSVADFKIYKHCIYLSMYVLIITVISNAPQI